MLSIVVAVAKNNVIGRAGGLPWHLSDDLKRFKRTTMGHHLIMGRKTHESIGRPLPGRTSIILTQRPGYSASGCLIASNIEEALQLAAGDDQVFVIGGAQIYAVALPLVQRLHWTSIDSDVDGDTNFPAINWTEWKAVSETHHQADERNDFDTTYRIYHRVS